MQENLGFSGEALLTVISESSFTMYDHLIKSHLQGYLASVKDEEVSKFLSNVDGNRQVWIGGRRMFERSTEFVWGDRSHLQYSNWLPGEPNNLDEGCILNNFR